MCVVVLSSVALLVVVVVVVVCVIFSVDVCQFSVVVFALPPFCLPAVAVEIMVVVAISALFVLRVTPATTTTFHDFANRMLITRCSP